MPKLALVRWDVLVASVAINLLSLGLPLVLLQVYNRIIPNQSHETLLLLIIGLAVVLVLDGVLRVARSYAAGWAGARFEHEALCKAAEIMARANVTEVEKTPVGEHLDRIGSIDTVREFYASHGVTLLIDLPFVVLFMGLVAYIAGPLVGLLVVLLGVFAVAAAITGSKLRSALADRAITDSRRFNFIIEVLNGIHTVKAMAMEALMVRRYERLQESAAQCSQRVTFLSANSQGLGTLFSQLTMVSVAAVGSIYVIQQELSVGGLAACTLLAGRTMQPLLRAMGIWTSFQNVRLGKEKLARVFEYGKDSTQHGGSTEPLEGGLRVEDLRFAYGEGGQEILKGINLEMAPGEVVGIRGGNGSGKSTLMWMLMGGLEPTAGRILYDGIDIKDRDISAMRRDIAYLPQQGQLFQGTVMDNLTTFRGTAHYDEAAKYARMLGLDEVFARMPDGFETMIGDSANQTLPNGLKQRICIARALAGDSKVILFDEANSGVDQRSDELLKDLVASLKGEHTMILITYRPSILRLCDRIFDLTDGHLVPSPFELAPTLVAKHDQAPKVRSGAA